MSLRLDHVSIRSADLAACRHFYVELLGLTVGPRPDFPFPGLWLYAGDRAVVHVIGTGGPDAAGLDGYLGPRDAAAAHGSGSVDHVAFAASGLHAMRERLAEAGVAVRERSVPGLGLHQLFVEDPGGVVVELNDPADEARAG